MEYIDPVSNERFIPYVVEPSLGADRVALAFLCDAYDEEELEGGDVRGVPTSPRPGPLQGRRPAAAEEQAGRQGPGTSTGCSPGTS